MLLNISATRHTEQTAPRSVVTELTHGVSQRLGTLWLDHHATARIAHKVGGCAVNAGSGQDWSARRHVCEEFRWHHASQDFGSLVQ
jgi:hypothetical protein